MTVYKKNLSDLKNVGKATLRDLHLLDIHTVDELSLKDATSLFGQLEMLTQSRQDPCVWDVFASIIHEAKTGEATSWWTWTGQRKILQKTGKLVHRF